jgi:hypothetical protein
MMTQHVPVIQLTGADDPFYYGLARRVGENRETIAFGEKFPMGGSTYPASLDKVPVEVISLWSSAVIGGRAGHCSGGDRQAAPSPLRARRGQPNSANDTASMLFITQSPHAPRPSLQSRG